ncbi:MAG: UDP-2,3-diacylglucosamine diphosphatase [Rhodoferax sp.]|jgi:UDP-2,3-diacylglucosamine hydrolase|nr:UDP-2,3-diacylglucosamine diphosphatase [Rhodoferax sp.]
MCPAPQQDHPISLPKVWPELIAAPRWRVVDVISDLHLQAAEGATFVAWQHYLADTPADAVFILGDLFEVWVGDDVLGSPGDRQVSFEARCQQVLAGAAQRLSLYFMHGNRDFLLGDDFAQGACTHLLSDPTVLDFDAQRWLLTHGDALCLGDLDYQQFRAMVRTWAWRDHFLSKPLNERQRIARAMRAQSESIKAAAGAVTDIDKPTACAWLQASASRTLIHGHTHRPVDELLQPASQLTLQRLVLCDWDASAKPPRLQALRLSTGQAPRRIALSSGF